MSDEPQYQYKAVITVERKSSGWITKKTVDSKYGPNDEASASGSSEIKTFLTIGLNNDTDLKATKDKILEIQKMLRETGEKQVALSDHLLVQAGTDFRGEVKALRDVEMEKALDAPYDEIVIECRRCGKPSAPGDIPLCPDHKAQPHCICCYSEVGTSQKTGKPYLLCGKCNPRIESRKKGGMDFGPACDDLRTKINREYYGSGGK